MSEFFGIFKSTLAAALAVLTAFVLMSALLALLGAAAI